MRSLSHEHFTVDGTLLEAWANQKSFRPKAHPEPAPSNGDKSNPTVDFRKEKRSNATHQSVTDPDARLARKGNGTTTKLCHLGSTLMDNRYGLVVATHVRPPSYDAEREAGVEMLTTLEPRRGTQRRRTLGADKGYDDEEFVDGVRQCHTTPHVTPNVHAKKPTSAIDGRTTRHAGFAVSQRSGSSSRRASAGGRSWGCSGSSGTGGANGWGGSSPSRTACTIWYGSER